MRESRPGGVHTSTKTRMSAPPPAQGARPPALDAAVSTVAAPGLNKPDGLFVLADSTLLARAGNSIRVLSPSGLLSFVDGSNTSSGNQDGPDADARLRGGGRRGWCEEWARSG